MGGKIWSIFQPIPCPAKWQLTLLRQGYVEFVDDLQLKRQLPRLRPTKPPLPGQTRPRRKWLGRMLPKQQKQKPRPSK